MPDLTAAETLAVYEAVRDGRTLLARPWTNELRATRVDVFGKELASVFATDRNLYGARALGRPSTEDGTLDEMKAWCDRVLSARAYRLLG